MFVAHGLKQHVQTPTHYKGHTLDVLLTKVSSNIVKQVQVRDPCFTDKQGNLLHDHFAICAMIDASKPRPIKTKVSFRRTKQLDLDSFMVDIKQSELHTVKDEKLVSAYHKVLLDLMDKHAPLVEKVITLRPNAPWFNEELAELKRQRRRLEEKWRNTSLTIDHEIYRNKCAEMNNKIMIEKSNYYRNKISGCGSDAKHLFKVANTLLGKCANSKLPAHTSPLELAERFSSFFYEKIQKIHKDLCDSRVDHQIEKNQNSERKVKLCNFDTVTQDHVINIIRKLGTKSCSLDPMPTSVLKHCIYELADIITRLINFSLTDASVPTQFKQAVIVPLLKKPGLDVDVLKNYRPVSNLSFISKVLEKVVLFQLERHLTQINGYVTYQSAYRKCHSTETALIRVQSDIMCAIDNRSAAALVLLDMSAAFDTIDHSLLLQRLRNTFGIDGKVLTWITSYLSDRFQKITIGNVTSQPKKLKQGVPQGSVLGPILFTLYTKPLAQIISKHGIDYHLYADDSQIYIIFRPGISTSDAIAKLELCIKEVSDWLSQNMLKLNSDKTEFIIFSSRHNVEVQSEISLRVGDFEIQPVKCIRNLGVFQDAILSMETNINNICRSGYFHLCNIGRIRKYLTADYTKSLVQALVISRLDYGNALLYGANDYLLQRLQRLQNLAARVIYCLPKREHITPHLVKLHWLPVQSRIEYKIILYVFKILHGTAPSYLCELIQEYKPARNLRSVDSARLNVPHVKTVTYGDKSFRKAAPLLWNNLPERIRTVQCVKTFKTTLKTHLFKQSYNL
jgi:hypothetical protein